MTEKTITTRKRQVSKRLRFAHSQPKRITTKKSEIDKRIRFALRQKRR